MSHKRNDFVITSPEINIDGAGGTLEVVVQLDTFAVDLRQARVFLGDGETPPASEPVVGVYRKPSSLAGSRADRAFELDASTATDPLDLDCSFDPQLLFVNAEDGGRAFLYVVVDNSVAQGKWFLEIAGTNRR